MDKYKIYVFHPYSKIGGADLSISRLIKNLDNKNFDVDFIFLNQQKLTKYLNLEKKNINFINVNSKRALFSIFKIRDHLIKDRKRRYKKYIFLSNQNFANILSFFILFKIDWIKQILIERNHIDEFKYDNSIKKKIIFILMKLLYKKADSIIGISKILTKDLTKLVNKKVVTIYNPAFDINIFKASKTKIHLKKKKNTFLTIGRLENQKDTITILKAFKLLIKVINARLIIIGYGSELKNIKNFISNNKLKNRITILTKVKNPFPYYKLADTFILSSKFEGFGNVLVEAAMFKLNIISSNCNSGPKEILKNGRYGQLFNVGDHVKLSKQMYRSLKNKKLYNRNELYNSLKRFDIKNNVSKYKKLFKQV